MNMKNKLFMLLNMKKSYTVYAYVQYGVLWQEVALRLLTVTESAFNLQLKVLHI